jgi:hypothetical protein
LLDSGLSPRDVADTLAGESGRARREIYQLVLACRDGGGGKERTS